MYESVARKGGVQGELILEAWLGFRLRCTVDKQISFAHMHVDLYNRCCIFCVVSCVYEVQFVYVRYICNLNTRR